MKYARVILGRVIETWDDNGWDITPYDVFVDEIAAQFEPCPEYVEPNWLKVNGEWVAPPDQNLVVENPPPFGAPEKAHLPTEETLVEESK